VLCVVRRRSLRRADHTSREVLSSACVRVCVSECDRDASIMKGPWPTEGCCTMEKMRIFFKNVLMFSAGLRKNKTRKIDVSDIDILCTTSRVTVKVVLASSLRVIRTILINIK